MKDTTGEILKLRTIITIYKVAPLIHWSSSGSLFRLAHFIIEHARNINITFSLCTTSGITHQSWKLYTVLPSKFISMYTKCTYWDSRCEPFIQVIHLIIWTLDLNMLKYLQNKMHKCFDWWRTSNKPMLSNNASINGYWSICWWSHILLLKISRRLGLMGPG